MDGYAVRAADVADAPVALEGDRRGRRRPAVRRRSRRRRGRAHLHRRRDAGRRRHRRDPGGSPRATATRVDVQQADRQGPQYARPGHRFHAKATCCCARAAASPTAISRWPPRMNYPRLPVHRRPKVALLATGDELVAPGSEPGPGQIVYSNGFALAALARARRRRGHRPRHRPRPARRHHRGGPPRRATAAPISCVTTGGASVGDHDLVQQALAAEGHATGVLADRDAARQADDARPARRHAGARPARQSGVVLCLRLPVPGAADPRGWPGRDDIEHRLRTAVLGCDLPANDERADYLRATPRPRPGRPGRDARSRSRTAP